MPYTIAENDGKWCVYKAGEDGAPEGETLGCHESEEDAQTQIAAIEEAEQAEKSAPVEEPAPEASAPRVTITMPDATIQVREGRVLSAKNRQLIADAVKQSKEAVTALQKLLEESDPGEREEVVRSLRAVRTVAEDDETITVGGYGIVWGGKDLYKTYFTPQTDLWLDRLGTRHVVLYDHGFDAALRKEVVGESSEEKPDKLGLWVAAQLKKHNEYVAGLKELLAKGALGWSSGAVAHLTEIDDETGEVRVWPVAEWSLTPTPAEPRTLGVKELRSLQDVVPAVRALIPKDGGKAAEADSSPSERPRDGSANASEPKPQQAAPVAAKRSKKMTEQVTDMEALAARTAEIIMEKQAAQAKEGGAYRIPADQGVQQPPAFKSIGDFLQSVVRVATGHGDERMRAYRATGMSEGVAADGGFLVHPQYANELLQKTYEIGQIAQLCKRYPIGANAQGLRINYINETSRANGSRWGGVTSYWLSEAGTKTSSKPSLGQIDLSLKKVIALLYATDELLEDAVALQSVVNDVFPQELNYAVEDAIINGTGAGQPLGILNAPCLVTVAKETGQAADTVVFNNVLKMWSRMWGDCRANAVWLISQDVEPQLYAMSMPVGTGGVPVYMPAGGLSGKPYGTLFGRPVIPSEYCDTLGDLGDIILADFSQYVLIDKGGLKSDSSIHVNFIYDETAFRWVYRVDGQPAWPSALTPKNAGSTLSPFVTLAARA